MIYFEIFFNILILKKYNLKIYLKICPLFINVTYKSTIIPFLLDFFIDLIEIFFLLLV